MWTISAPRPFPKRAAVRRPRGPQGCKTHVYLDETRARPLAGNQARSTDWREIRQLWMVESRGPLLVALQFRLRLL